MDDLSSIERVYGSVAEYNRVMSEDDSYSELTLEEEIDLNNELAIYGAKIKLLNGNPSSFIVDLKKLLEKKQPKEIDFSNKNEYITAGYEFYRYKCIEVMDKISEYYGVKINEEGKTFYNPGENRFGISVSYSSRYSIAEHKFIVDLDYELFKNIFRDLDYIGLSPTMSYEFPKEKKAIKPLIMSNTDLGTIRSHYMVLAGIESNDSINAEIESLGFDENEVIAENMKKINERTSKKI